MPNNINTAFTNDRRQLQTALTALIHKWDRGQRSTADEIVIAFGTTQMRVNNTRETFVCLQRRANAMKRPTTHEKLGRNGHLTVMPPRYRMAPRPADAEAVPV